MIKKRAVRVFLSFLLSAFFLYWIVKQRESLGNFSQLYHWIHSFSVPLVILSIGILLIMQYLRAWRVSILTTGQNNLPSESLFSIAVFHNLLNSILPAKLGEAALPLFLAKFEKVTFLTGAGTLVVVRILDLLFVVCMGATSALLIFKSEISKGPFYVLLIATPLALFFLIFFPKIMDLAFNALGAPRYARSIILKSLKEIIRPIHQNCISGHHGVQIILTGTIWVLNALYYWICIKSVTQTLDFIEVVLASSAASISYALPINGVANIGPMEAAWATALKLAGEDWGKALLMGLWVHFLLIIENIILGGIFAFFILIRRAKIRV